MTLDLYADGGVIGRNPSPDGGTWAFVVVYRETDTEVLRGMGLVLPIEVFSDKVTNNQTEYLALVNGLEALPEDWSGTPGMIFSDSNVSLGRLFRGWATKNLDPRIVTRGTDSVRRIRPKNGQSEVPHTLLDGHPTAAQLKSGVGKRGHPVSKWNALCDKLCNDLSKSFLDAKAKD
jgi:ribonuclease HI